MPPVNLTVVQNDKGYQINFTLVDSQNVAVNLSGASLAIEGQLISDYSVTFSGNLTVTSAATGQCAYTVGATDFQVPGTYAAQITATFGSSEILTFTNIQFTIDAKLPLS